MMKNVLPVKVNFAITGHTSGLGKIIYEKLSPNCVGFSKSSGYDLNSGYDRQRIIEECSNIDVFINCASPGFAQTWMLIDLWREWKEENKTIINIGSRIAQDDIVVPLQRQDLLPYQAQKTILKITHENLTKYDLECNLVYKSFGYIGTEEILKKYPHFTEDDYITPEKACWEIINEFL